MLPRRKENICEITKDEEREGFPVPILWEPSFSSLRSLMAVQIYNGTLTPFNAATDLVGSDHYSYVKLVDATGGSTNLAKVDALGRLANKSIIADLAGTNILIIDSAGRMQAKTVLADSAGTNLLAVDVNGRLQSKSLIVDSAGTNLLAVDAAGRMQGKNILLDGAGTNMATIDSQGMVHTRIAPMTEAFLAPSAIGDKYFNVAQVAVNLSTKMTGAAATATHAFIRVLPSSQAALNWWIDGDTPTQGAGMFLGIGEAEEFSSIATMKMISSSATLPASLCLQFKKYNSTTF
jgi:hypothetical protein